MPAPLLLGPGIAVRRLRVADADVVWLRSILEGYDGLASLYGDGSGVVVVTTTDAQSHELDALLAELRTEAAFLPLD